MNCRAGRLARGYGLNEETLRFGEFCAAPPSLTRQVMINHLQKTALTDTFLLVSPHSWLVPSRGYHVGPLDRSFVFASLLRQGRP